MKTLQIGKSKAREIYETASYGLKTMLEDAFGKEFFSVDVTDCIKTYEDACEELDITPIDESVMLSNGFTKDEIAYRKIKTIAEALNGCWKPDWSNVKQKKWVPWFRSDSSGFVFDESSFVLLDATTSYGGHLCFKREDLADYAAKQFVEIYKEFII